MDIGTYRILLYDYVDDIAERRGPDRPDHLALLERYKADGRVVAAGATGNPVSGAAIVFRGESDDVVHGYLEADPYVTAGLVVAWRVVPWNVVV